MEQINGYEILKSTVFANSRGFALGHNPAAPSPYVTWQFTEGKDGQRDYYWGHYGNSREWAGKRLYPSGGGLQKPSADDHPKHFRTAKGMLSLLFHPASHRPGTFPKPAGNPPLEIINYDDDRRRPVAGGNIEAWGELIRTQSL